jgi:hypothetical protein
MDDDNKSWPNAMPYEPPAPDPAILAFNKVEREVALLRRAVEQLATEKASIDIPDYSSTLAEMTAALVTIEDMPAMQMTPEDMGKRMEAAALRARREDQAALAEARKGHTEALRDLRTVIGNAATIAEQEKRRRQWGIGGLVLGCLLWAALPGFAARIGPTSWHWPEHLATRTLREPSLWDAGSRLMQADSPQAWQDLNSAATMFRQNRDAIERCRKAADKTQKATHCAIEIGPRS